MLRVALVCTVALLLITLPLTLSITNTTSKQAGWFNNIISAIKNVVKTIVNTISNFVKAIFPSPKPPASSGGPSTSPETIRQPSTNSRAASSNPSFHYSGSSVRSTSNTGTDMGASNILNSILGPFALRSENIKEPQIGERVSFNPTNNPFDTNKGEDKGKTSALPLVGITAIGLAAFGISYRFGKSALNSVNEIPKFLYRTSDALGHIKNNLKAKQTWQAKWLYSQVNNAQFNIDFAIGTGEAAHDTITGIIELPKTISQLNTTKGAKFNFKTKQALPIVLYPFSPGLSLVATAYQTDPVFAAELGYGIGAGLLDYYTKDYDEHPGRAWGRVFFDVGTIALPASKLGGASKIGKAGKARKFNIFRNIFRNRRSEEVIKIENTLREEKSFMKQIIPDLNPETTNYFIKPIKIRGLIPNPSIYGEAISDSKWINKKNRVTKIIYYSNPIFDLTKKWGDDFRRVIIRHELFHKSLLETESAWKMVGNIPTETRNWLMDTQNKIKIGSLEDCFDEPLVDILVAASDAKIAPAASAFSQSRWGLAPMSRTPIEPYKLTKMYIQALEKTSAKHGLPHLQKFADLLTKFMKAHMKKGHPLPAIAIGTNVQIQNK